MNYFNLLKFAQIENLLTQKGYSAELSEQIKNSPKAVRQYIAQLIERKPLPSETQLLNILQNPQLTQPINKTDRFTAIFHNQPYTKEQFFQTIPEGYKPFVSRILLSKEKKPEDLPAIKETLNNFTQIKSKTTLPIKRDINKYQSYSELYKIVKEYALSDKQAPTLRVDPTTLPGVTLYEQQGPYKIWAITDPKSLSILGKGTQWCTREDYGDEEDGSMASHYLGENATYEVLYIVTKGAELICQFTPDLSEVKDTDDEEFSDTTFSEHKINLDRFVEEEIKSRHKYVEYDADLSQILSYASDDYLSNPKLMLAAVTKDPHAIEYASPDIKGNPKIVLQAIKTYPYALSYASITLRNDPEFILKAFESKFAHRDSSTYTELFEYVGSSLKSNKEFVATIVSRYPQIYKILNWDMKDNENIALAAIKTDKNIFKYLPVHLQYKFKQYEPKDEIKSARARY